MPMRIMVRDLCVGLTVFVLKSILAKASSSLITMSQLSVPIVQFREFFSYGID